MRASRWAIGVCSLLGASVVCVWLLRRRQPGALSSDKRGGCEEQGWPAGSRVRWIDEPYVEEGPSGERLEVRVGDEGTVVMDDSPTEFCVTFPAIGAFCPPRSSVVLIERSAEHKR